MISKFFARLLLMLAVVVFIMLNSTKFALYWQHTKAYLLAQCAKSKYIHCQKTLLPTNKIPLGIYSPSMPYPQDSRFEWQHFFVTLDSNASQKIAQIRQNNSQNSKILISFEPFYLSQYHTYQSQINSKEYMELISSTCQAASTIKTPQLFIRIAHEMEKPVARYPWSNLSTDAYIKFFRQSVESCRKYSPQAKFVFSPLGLTEALKFYPGDDVVDMISFPVFYYEDYAKISGHTQTPRQIVQNKYDLLKAKNKPLLIAEFGIASSTPSTTAKLSQEFFSLTEYFPLLEGVIFFDAVDHPGVWGEDLPAPDFRLQKIIHLTIPHLSL